MTFERPEKNNLRTHGQASTTSARIVQTSARNVQISELITPKSERGATKNATKNRIERQIANDIKRRELTQAPSLASLKASNVDDPRAEKGVTTSTTHTLSAVLLTRALVILT